MTTVVYTLKRLPWVIRGKFTCIEVVFEKLDTEIRIWSYKLVLITDTVVAL
jgi:hypothetical protein